MAAMSPGLQLVLAARLPCAQDFAAFARLSPELQLAQPPLHNPPMSAVTAASQKYLDALVQNMRAWVILVKVGCQCDAAPHQFHCRRLNSNRKENGAAIQHRSVLRIILDSIKLNEAILARLPMQNKHAN